MTHTPNLPPLPGFGLPLDNDNKSLFASALTPNSASYYYEPESNEACLRALTLRELAMLDFMNEVTDKKEWQTKIYDESILKKWKTEVFNKGNADTLPDDDDDGQKDEDAAGNQQRQDDTMNVGDNKPGFTEKMFKYCIGELRWKAKLHSKSGFIKVFNGDVVKSDDAIPKDLQAALKSAIAPLENVPENKRDWHPGSNQQVLDLVHPSLFPLVYGLSRILPNSTTNLEDCVNRCGEGQVLPVPKTDSSISRQPMGKKYYAYSTKFQWLPCEVDISGDNPKILSYINNLHPKEHAELYEVIEKILARIIPLWNATLSPLRTAQRSRTPPPPPVDYGYVEYQDEDWEHYVKNSGPKQEEGEDEYEFEDRYNDWEADYKPLFYTQPDVRGPFRPPSEEDEMDKVDLKNDYSSKGLQVIVKLANIHLTPEKPKYAGGSWHVEGQLNEHICASAIYYYDCENIATSYLAFRQAVNQPDVDYEQNDNEWIRSIFGLRNNEPGVQVVGSINTREGRVITFPNILQHQVQPFELEDPTKPGHRKILALFLVDPNIKIISTANVPCQRRDWWADVLSLDLEGLAKFPVELRDNIVNSVDDFPISLSRAKELREELMEGRKEYVVGYQQANFKSVTISLCEH